MEFQTAQAGDSAGRRPAALVWVAIALAALVVAGWYYYAYYLRAPLPAGPDAATEQFQTQGTSDEVSAIEQDLNATGLGDLDKELSDIEAELGL